MVNPQRFDPYKAYRFRVKWDGRYVAGVSRISPVNLRNALFDHQSRAGPSTVRTSPGRSKFEPITLERGLTHDSAFEDWADKTWRLGAGRVDETAIADFRRDVRLEVYNEAGKRVEAYDFHRCWVSGYQALPQLDAGAAAIAIQQMTLQCDGVERDKSVVEPAEPR